MILVTGAAGFIGSHVVERLLADGHAVLGIDNFDSYYARAIKEANLAGARSQARFRFAEVDVRDEAALADALASAGGEQLESVVHLAARAGVRPSIADPEGYHDVNVRGTQRVLELARRAGARQFVFGSSSSVYGVNPRVPWREEDGDVRPISPYATSKLAAEACGRACADEHGLRFVALRFFNAYGPRLRPDLAIAKFARLMREGRPLPMFGDGSTKRDYTYVADLVDGVARALRYTAAPFEIINLGNHHTISLADMIAAVARVFGAKPHLERLPEQPGEVPQTWADIGKARRLLGWEPHTDLEQGLRHYRDWFERLETPAKS
jgi:UDP-glucuronate 4-epimerase